MASKCEVPYIKKVTVSPLCSPDTQKVHYNTDQCDGGWHISALKALGKVKPVSLRGVCRWGNSGSTAFGDVHYYNYDDGE